ncbi:PREDICTED: CD44 antigen isoform X4 [Calidris pugnax]|uniref:CD44 antigen isoform X4 n=1 Tax=Calidris pugnax TaxID=198806 RepID=UPI00071D4F60|nr:PREDICTED: CD44 antigen isoform X4 [Calidris pugnax]
MTSLWAAVGLCLLKLCLAETQFNVSCRYGGVFHVEKNGRYSLTRSEAVELCRALNSTLATLEQLKRAHELGFETCRYGFVVGNIVIPRINPYHLCAANHTGIYKLSANTTGRYDAYCYNETETRDKTCEPIERLDTSLLSNQGEIVIDNADGSRYNPDGTRHSGESSTSGADDENVGSGSTHDTTPMDTSVRRSSPSYYGSATPVSQLPDHSSGGGEKDIPREDLDDETSPVSPDIPLVTAVDNSPTKDDGQYPASTTDVTSSGNGSDDEDSSEETIYPTVFPDWDRSVAKDEYAPSTTTDSQHEILLEVSTQNHWNPAYTDEEEQYPSSAGRALVTSENENRQGPTPHPLLHSVHYGWISQEHNPANSTGSTEQHEFTVGGENDIEKESSHTAAASPGGAHHEDPTQPPLPSDSEPGQGTEGITHPRGTPGNEVLDRTSASTNEAGDDSPLMGTIAESVDDVNQEKATKEPLAPTTPSGSESEQVNTTDGSDVNWIPGVFPGIEDHLNQLQTPLPTRSTSSIDGNQGPHKGHHESTTFPGETTTTTIVSQPRSAQVPEWLIIVAALVALALILAVCIAVNSRRRCGQKKKLVINNGKGAVEDRKTSGLNGDASKSQEMVHLVHKEPSNDQTGACDEFLTINETQNHQELDMKSGV